MATKVSRPCGGDDATGVLAGAACVDGAGAGALADEQPATSRAARIKVARLLCFLPCRPVQQDHLDRAAELELADIPVHETRTDRQMAALRVTGYRARLP
jgi:hypothetical protein